jgi:hypothetical protein
LAQDCRDSPIPSFAARLSGVEIATLNVSEYKANMMALEWMKGAAGLRFSRMFAIPCDRGSVGSC